MKNWPILGPCILGFDKLIVYFIHNIGGMGCITISTIIFMICVMCDQVWASFNAQTLHLQLLPIILGYWWNFHFVDPLRLTIQHNHYMLVMIEHFCKCLKLVPLLHYSSKGVMYASLIGCLVGLALQLKYLLIKIWNFAWNFMNYVNLFLLIIKLLDETILRQMGQLKEWFKS